MRLVSFREAAQDDRVKPTALKFTPLGPRVRSSGHNGWRWSACSSLVVLLLGSSLTGKLRAAAELEAAPPAGAPEAKTAPAGRLEDQVIAHGDMKLILSPARQEIEIRFRDQPLLLYAMAPTNFKPYVKELRTLAGRNLLLDAPPDHLHHHGLMYAVTVNGTNFWEEQVAPGVQRLLAVPSRIVGVTPDGRPRATFTHPLAWLPGVHRASTNALAEAVLVERRTLTLAVDPQTREVALYWRGEFAPGPTGAPVTLSGTAYHGLGLRFVREFDLKARHLNSEGAPYSAEQKGDVIPARWAATLGRVGEHDVMAAMFAGPRNAGSSRFFSMINPFAYLSATQGLDSASLTYQQGDRFQLDYLVLVRDDHLDAAALEARYRKWVEELVSSPGK